MRTRLIKEEPIVLITPEVYKKITKIRGITKKSLYFGGMMTVNRVDNVYTLKDIYIIRQKTSYNDTDVSEFKELEYYNSFDDTVTQDTLNEKTVYTLYETQEQGEILSFNVLGVVANKEYKPYGFYDKDEALCKKLFKNRGISCNGLYLVVDKNGEIHINVIVNTDGYVVEGLDWNVDYNVDVDIDEFKKEISDNLLSYADYNKTSITTYNTNTTHKKEAIPTQLSGKYDVKKLT